MATHKTHLITIAALIASVTLAGCSNSNGSQSTATSTTTGNRAVGSSTTSAESGTTTVSSGNAPTPKTLSFTYTDTQGWTYTGSLPIPGAQLNGTADISSSPPNEAKLQLSLTVSPEQTEQASFSDTNPGRPDGPQLVVQPGILYFPVGSAGSSLGQDMEGDVGPGEDLSVGPCSLLPVGTQTLGAWGPSGTADVPIGLYPDPPNVAENIACHPSSGSGEWSISDAQGDVQAVVSALSGLQPYYDLTINDNGYYSAECDILISPTGSVQQNPASSSSGCGSLVASVK